MLQTWLNKTITFSAKLLGVSFLLQRPIEQKNSHCVQLQHSVTGSQCFNLAADNSIILLSVDSYDQNVHMVAAVAVVVFNWLHIAFNKDPTSFVMVCQ